MPRETIQLPGLPEISVRRHPRAKHFRLSYDRTTGAFRVSVPTGMSVEEIRRYIRKHADWIARRQTRTPDRIPFETGQVIPILGVDHAIEPASGVRAVTRRDGRLILPASTPDVPARVLTYLKKLAGEELTRRAQQHHATLRTLHPAPAIQRITVRDQKSRWGSCSARGALAFNWRIVMAPEEVLDYLAAHEVTHLAHMNHSPAFWATCRKLAPQTRTADAWLNREGGRLARYGPPRS